MASMIADLLKTPQQVRQERQDAMRQNSLAQAALLSRGASGSTALPGLLRGFAAQQLVEQGPQMENTVRRGLGAAGMLGGAVGALTPQQVQATQQLGIPQEEQRAMQLNALAREATSTDPAKLKETADKLRAAGRPDIAAQIDERVKELEQAATQTTMREALAQQFRNIQRDDLAMLALNPDSNMLELVKELRLSQEKPEGASDVSLSPTERKIYNTYLLGDEDTDTSADKELSGMLDEISRGDPGLIRSLLNLPAGVEGDEKRLIALEAAERAEQYRAGEGKGLTQKQALEFVLKEMLVQKEAQREEVRRQKEKQATPIDVQGLEELDEAAGFEEQTNPFAIGVN